MLRFDGDPMSLMFRIIYAAHANGTHHKLALDALTRLRGPDAEGWRSVFLKHVALYLEGSKAPDNTFKDFKNHVLHVRDNYWGGAPEKVENWYGHLVAALKAQNWSEAVYAAGVLSHYYTDPIHPFHTGQTEAESNIHRAVEWSINRSYGTLKDIADKSFADLDVVVPAGETWLRDMTLAGADFSNRYYEKLIAHYDISRGVVDPPAGLDAVGRKLVAELLAYAAAGFAHILDRAIADSEQTPPDVSLALDTVIAGLQVPMKALQKRLSNAADRELVQRMYDELKTTGKVDKTLPEDDRTVRDLFAVEVQPPRAAEMAKARAARLLVAPVEAAPARPSADLKQPPAPAHGAAATPPAEVVSDAPISIDAATAVHALEVAVLDAEKAGGLPLPEPMVVHQPVSEVEAAPAPLAAAEAASDTTEVVGDPETEAEPVALDEAAPAAEAPAADPVVLSGSPATASKRPDKFYLTLTDDIERAPSIGPKMARRFSDVGVVTVADFLDEDVEQLSTMLGRRALTARVLKDWQDQARLVMAIPGLRGTHAQLLVGAGYRGAAAIADADADTLCAAITTFAVTSEGQSVLRDGNPPDVGKIKGWVENAALARAA